MNRSLIRHNPSVSDPHEITEGTFDAGVLLSIPERPDDHAAEVDRLASRGHPDVANHAGALDIAQLESLSGANVRGGRALPTDTQLARRLATRSALTGTILVGNGSRFHAAINEIRLMDHIGCGEGRLNEAEKENCCYRD
jgi:hypothetical protein